MSRVETENKLIAEVVRHVVGFREGTAAPRSWGVFAHGSGANRNQLSQVQIEWYRLVRLFVDCKVPRRGVND